jgi:DNA helicase HerA-like ATPase
MEMTAEVVGRVFGGDISEIRFRASHEVDIRVGEMLVIDDGSRSFLVRLTDIEYGAEEARDEWVARQAGRPAHSDEVGMQKRLFKVGVCVPLGIMEGGGLTKAKTIPRHLAQVRRVGLDDLAFLEGKLGDLRAGRMRSGDRVLDLTVGIQNEALPMHVGIFATTGMGKSNLMKCLALSCMRSRKCGFLILDPHGEYNDGGGAGKKGLRDYAGAGEALLVLSSRKLDGPHSALKISSSEIDIPDLANLYEFTGAQVECLQTAQYKLGNNWLAALLERDVSKLMGDLNGRFGEGTISVIKRRLESVFRFDLITTDQKHSVTKQVISALDQGMVVLVDTSNMFEAEELLVSTVLTRAIFERNRELYAERKEFARIPSMLVALEEAQRVLGQAKGTVFAQIAREGRKFKLGICAVTQQPKLINEEIISQFNTLFVLGLADRRDRDILRNSAKQDVAMLENEIQMLMPGEALIASPFTPFAIPARIDLFETYLQEANAAIAPETAKPTRDRGFF